MTLRFGFYAAHEQYDACKLLDFAVKAEKNGFDTIWCSDHFHPWSHTNANSSRPTDQNKFIKFFGKKVIPYFKSH